LGFETMAHGLSAHLVFSGDNGALGRKFEDTFLQPPLPAPQGGLFPKFLQEEVQPSPS
jgi:hypothetical protein